MKGHGFVENADFLIFGVISRNLVISIKITGIPEFTRISKICEKIAPLRRRVKTAVIHRYFNGPGAHFPAPDHPKPDSWCF